MVTSLSPERATLSESRYSERRMTMVFVERGQSNASR